MRSTNKCTTECVLLNNNTIILTFILSLTILITLISIGYAALNTNLNISGEAFLRAKGSVRISKIELANVEGAGYETYISEYSKKTIKVYSTLLNIDSKITYNAQITNTTEAKYMVSDIEITSTNPNVECTSTLVKDTIIESGILDFNIKVKYKSGAELNEGSTTTDVCSIKYEFIPLDLIPPTLKVELISQDINTAKIKITAQDEEDGSGLSNDNIYKYCLSTKSDAAQDCTWTNYISGEELDIIAPTVGIYYIFVYSISDKAGNISDEKDSIGQEINKLELSLFNKITNFNYTGSEQTYTVPTDGYYKIEAWGAQGWSDDSTATGGMGGYTSGYIYLTKGEILYVYVGKGNGNGSNNESFNNGTPNYDGESGGGATDIRLVGGTWTDDISINSRIMVAGGGGSGNNGKGAHGGGLYGNDAYGTSGGTQTSSGASQVTNYTSSSFGIANGGCTGGNGYYPGGGATCVDGAGGGSSFISGYAGVNAITSSTDRTHTDDTLHYSEKYFINATMEIGINTGDGKAKITYISKEKPERVNTKLNNVRYIKDCTVGNSINEFNHWVELQAIYQGKNIAKGKTITSDSLDDTSLESVTFTATLDGNIDSVNYSDLGENNKCIIVDLGNEYDLDEIATWHYWKDNRTYYENTTYVSSNNIDWTSITMPAKEESSNGNRVNAYESEIEVNPYLITNLINNSGFENGTTNINLYQDNSISTNFVYSGIYSLYTSTKNRFQGSSLTVNSDKISIDDKMYITERVLVTDYDSSTNYMYMALSNANGYDYIIAKVTGITGNWMKISNVGIVTSTNNTGNYSVYGNLFYIDSNTSDTVNSAYIDNLALFNLTAVFGSGSEPDKAWCDTNIPYISDSATLYLPK